MLALFCIGLVCGVGIGFVLAGMNSSMFLSKIPDPELWFNQTYVPPNNNTNGNGNTTPSDWTPVTHFEFNDDGANNGGKGFIGIYNPSTNIYYLRWHTVSIREVGLKEGLLLVHYGYKDNSNVLHNQTKTLGFVVSETKTGLEFLIPVTEITKEEINFATTFIELIGEK